MFSCLESIDIKLIILVLVIAQLTRIVDKHMGFTGNFW